MRLLRVYKERESSTWYWSCAVPFCGANDWAAGGQPGALRAGTRHLARHRTVGFRR
jgi:hypothetical protein